MPGGMGRPCLVQARWAGGMADPKGQPRCPDPPDQKGLDLPGGEVLRCPGDG